MVAWRHGAPVENIRHDILAAMPRRTVLALLPLLVTGLVACGGSKDEATPAATTADGVVEVTVEVRDGEVHPGTRRVEVPEGSQVRLVITSDVDDEVHVHGYDAETALEAGRPSTLELVADQTGVFEVETHEGGLELVQLQVR